MKNTESRFVIMDYCFYGRKVNTKNKKHSTTMSVRCCNRQAISSTTTKRILHWFTFNTNINNSFTHYHGLQPHPIKISIEKKPAYGDNEFNIEIFL